MSAIPNGASLGVPLDEHHQTKRRGCAWPSDDPAACRQQARRLLGLPVEAAPVGLLLAGARARRRGAHIVALRERETA